MKYPFSGIIVRYILDDQSVGARRATRTKDELHVNLWEVSGRQFIDIGVMIQRPKEIKAIQIDLPWKFDRSKVFDLGSRLVGEKIVAAIFNEVVHYNGSNDHTFAEVSLPSSNGELNGFTLVRLNSSNFSTEPIMLSEGGTTTKLTVTLPTVEDPSPFDRQYFRFRIIDIPESIYTAKFLQKDRNLLSSSLETRIVDFRINVRRGVPDDVLATRPALFFPPWKKIHLFITLDRVREMTFNSENFVACRSLEDEEIWNSYIALDSHSHDHSGTVSDYLGYQWTVKSKTDTNTNIFKPAKDLVALARFSQVTSSWWYMLKFLILALFIGAAGNGAWEIWSNLFPPPKADENNTLQKLVFLILIITATVFITPVLLKRLWKELGTKIRKLLVKIGRLFRDEN